MEILEERRKRPRFVIPSKVKWREADAMDFEEVELENISEIGTFIWSTRQLEVGNVMLMVIESENPNELPVRCTLKIVRRCSRSDDRRFGYGCRIEKKTDPNVE